MVPARGSHVCADLSQPCLDIHTILQRVYAQVQYQPLRGLGIRYSMRSCCKRSLDPSVGQLGWLLCRNAARTLTCLTVSLRMRHSPMATEKGIVS